MRRWRALKKYYPSYGKRDGDEVVQLYIGDMVSIVTRAVQELKDFSRIHLKNGETKTLSFTISGEKLQYFGQKMKRVIEPVEFEVQVGKSSNDYLSTRFEIIK